MSGGFREEVLNVELARLLVARGLVSAPETIERSSAGRRSLPDVVVNFRGLRVLLEGKTDDVAGAREVVSGDAHRRVEQGLAHIALGVVYPHRLRSVSFGQLGHEMAASPLDVQVHTEGGAGGWVRVTQVDGLVELLVRTYEQLVSEDVVVQAVEIVEAAIDRFERELRGQVALEDRILELMEVGEPEGAPGADPDA
ncbi:MAG: hypothetical protein ABSD62_13305 [Candidatus Limnocylindrales bacterium]|jgi:hypothetical protein